MRNTVLLAVLAATALPATAAFAQSADRVLVIYGNDKCPTNASGEEIYVCARRPDSERYRIPKELRTPIEITPENRSWAMRANETLSAGAGSGIGSCSAVGPGAWTGCWAQQMRAARAERRAGGEIAPSVTPTITP